VSESEQEYASKRERQKARRAERLEREAAAAKTAKGKQTAVYGLVVVLVVALIGGLVYSQIAQRQAREALVVEVAARLDSLGCTPAERQPEKGGGHIAGSAEALAVEPPEVIYDGDEPPSSGRHVGQVAATGVYDVPIDPRLTTHNLEHAYVVAHYGPDAPADEVEALKEWGQDAIGGDFPKVIVAPYHTEMVDGANFAFTAWHHRQVCDTFDADVAQVFAQTHHGSTEAPESGAAVHLAGAQGVLEPEDGEPLFLPPLDAEFGTDSQIEEAEEAGENTPEVDDEGNPVDAEGADDGAAEDVEG
jgi:hypothetical protein